MSKGEPNTRSEAPPWLDAIPAHWEKRRIKSLIIRAENGAWGEDERGDEHDVFCYRAADFDTDRMLVKADKLVKRHIEPDVFRRKAVRPEHLLIEKSGGGENVPVGRVVRSLLSEPAVFSNFLGLLEIDERKADSNFMRYQFWHLYDRRVPWRSIKQTTGLQNLDTSSYYVEHIALPPLVEQRAIAAFLDERIARIDGLIARKERLVALLKERRQAIITRAVTRGLVPSAQFKDSGVDWLGEVPEVWDVVALKYAIGPMEQGWSPQCENYPADEIEWGVLKAGCVNGIALNEQENKRLPDELEPDVHLEIRAGDILMSRANTTDLVGSCVYVSTVRPKLILCDKLYRFHALKGVSDGRYLVYFLRSKAGRSYMEQHASGASDSMQNIGQDVVRNAIIPLPPIHVQEQIVSFLDRSTNRIDALLVEVARAVRRLHEYRSSLISAAVTGKIRVPVPDEHVPQT